MSETSPPVPNESSDASLLGGEADSGDASPLLGGETAEEPVVEEDKEDLTKIPFFKRLGKKQFWGNIGKAITKSTKSGAKAASEGIKSLGKKDTWVGDKGAFGKETWAPVGQNIKSGFNKIKDKDTWVGEKGAFGKETWAGETGVFGANNRAKAKALVDKAKDKFKKSPKDGDAEIDEDDGTRQEKERIALTMLKEGQISQEEYDQLVNDLSGAAAAETTTEAAAAVETESLVSSDGVAAAAEPTEPFLDGRDCVDTADL